MSSAKAKQGFELGRNEREELLQQISKLWSEAMGPANNSSVLPDPEALNDAASSLIETLPEHGKGLKEGIFHILHEISPGFYRNSPTYYGFVTGGATPAAQFADQIVTAFDQNVQVHIPSHSISTLVEQCTLKLLLDLFGLDKNVWCNGTFTTGATASNILGLACGRQYGFDAFGGCDIAEQGLMESMRAGNIDKIKVLSTLPHSSVTKAAGILGIGRLNVQNVSRGHELNPVLFDYDRLEQELAQPRVVSIVVVSCSEVNTGFFATKGFKDFERLRKLCDKYRAWLHVDGAFGLFARCLPPEFNVLLQCCDGIELADSITVDAHKQLNVPYDCGVFFCRHPGISESVFKNTGAPYLGNSRTKCIESPNNIGIENSRRFRALPVYASLITYGKSAYSEMVGRQVSLARSIASWLWDHPSCETLPRFTSKEKYLQQIFIIVLFRAKYHSINAKLAASSNSSRRIYVSATSWEGIPACRIAVSNWNVDVLRDLEATKSVLDEVLQVTA